MTKREACIAVGETGVACLSAVGLSKTFDGTRALDDVTVSFAKNAITALVGPNGAGKTTLLNVFSGFLRPDAGQCFVDGRDISHMAPHRIAQLGVGRTFQDLRIVGGLTVLEHAMLARGQQRGERVGWAVLGIGVRHEEEENREAGLRALGYVGLETKASTRAADLSYGEQKLLTIACCLAAGRRTLVMDEPVAGIHPAMVSDLTALLRRLCGNGRSLIVVEHDLTFVRELAAEVVVMDEGRIVAQGLPRSVLERTEVLEAFVD